MRMWILCMVYLLTRYCNRECDATHSIYYEISGFPPQTGFDFTVAVLQTGPDLNGYAIVSHKQVQIARNGSRLYFGTVPKSYFQALIRNHIQ
ncbi:uncharacterized protein BDZ99DRAFT_467690 [Mytilinidion resinicola]|uniref:Reelin domain-containing protein n=1 Tax=Mytilinidion resinicola TaxID=574789 RepID=A0A6A6Y5M5_9PEZI|nr:uncharacterized protein BDZ99DRAFT_467690 [Mytilinidion resinicola]KAF2803960.1 hypothetical protein BDZ99DRAFT_467690 [Mytilinidion resinicola]